MSEDDKMSLSINEAAELLQSDISSLSQHDTITDSLRDVLESPAPIAMLRQLQNYGVDNITLSEKLADDPLARFNDVMTAGNDTMRDAGVPLPHVEDYFAAQAISQQTGHSLIDVVEKFESLRPQELRVELNDEDLAIPVGSSTDDVVQAPDGVLANALEDVEPQNYQQYDVHLMSYPLAATELGDYVVGTRFSHAFVVVTEKGVDPDDVIANPDLALLVTRAGPDDGRFGSSSNSGSSSSNSNEQSPTDKGTDGDVYVADFEESARDLDATGVVHHRTSTIKGNILDIKNEISEFREFINERDIDYQILSSNSNTYASDVYELLTNEQPGASIQDGRIMPAFGNDLLDYEKTEYSHDFTL